MFELTPDNAAEFLRSRGHVTSPSIHVEPLGWGVSNAVLRVTTPERLLVVKQSRPRLRTRDAWFSRIDRVFREVAVMQLLGPLLPAGTVPEVLFVDQEHYLFGMSHAPLDAVVWKEQLLQGRIELAVAGWAGTVLGMMHEQTAQSKIENRKSKISDVDLTDPTVFIELRVEPFYERVCERRPEVADVVRPLIGQMLSTREALCHGDFSPKNFLVSPGAAGRFMLVDYETACLGDPTMDLGFFLSHLLLKAIKNHDRRHLYFQLTDAFWNGYRAQVRFKPIEALMARGIQHLAVCALARIDGTSPVDYLPEEPKREAVRQLSRRLLRDRPGPWPDVLAILEETLAEQGVR
jgi:5-methylthioribose kinase